MKPLFLVFITLLSLVKLNAQSFLSPLVQFQNHSFYSISNESSNKLLIFLHGGVNNPAFAKDQPTPDLDFLLENNESFVDSASHHGFDLLIPIKDDNLNWLSNYGYCHRVFAAFLDSAKTYSAVYLSGFSDGGTGSYRIFYDNPSSYEGLIVFNGYPQHQNHNMKVDYTRIKMKKVLFISTFDDDVIPYEFLLSEYAKQKASNPDTYLYITKGRHSFAAYNGSNFNEIFDMLNQTSDNSQTEPLHGYVRQDSLIEFYPFRKKINRKYGYGKNTMQLNNQQKAMYID